MSLETPSFKAVGDIYPSRFVNVADDSGKDFYVEELVDSADTFKNIGISDVAGRDARHDVNDTRAALDGEDIKVYGMGAVCLLEMAATCNRGDLLKPNTSTDGKGVPCSTSTGSGVQFYGAKALESCTVSGQKIRVQVVQGYVPSGGMV
jgi:hypothetical protein